MKMLKFGAMTALAAMLATPAMAYLSKDQINKQLTGYGHGNGLADFGPNGKVIVSGTGPNHAYMADNSGGPTWTWPVPLRHSGTATAMNTMNMGPGHGVPHAVE